MSEFKGRCFIVGDEVVGLKVFDGKLEPMVAGRRGVEEWMDHSLGEMDAKWFRGQFGLPDGDHQVLFSGEAWSGWSQSMDGEEYEEEIELTKIESEPVPVEFAKWCLLGEEDEGNVDSN